MLAAPRPLRAPAGRIRTEGACRVASGAGAPATGKLVELQPKVANDLRVLANLIADERVELLRAHRRRFEADRAEALANGWLGEGAVEGGVDLQHDLARRGGGGGEADGARVGEAGHGGLG